MIIIFNRVTFVRKIIYKSGDPISLLFVFYEKKEGKSTVQSQRELLLIKFSHCYLLSCEITTKESIFSFFRL